jgi:hypothetical protein
MVGKGVPIFVNGNRYEGEFVDGLPKIARVINSWIPGQGLA